MPFLLRDFGWVVGRGSLCDIEARTPLGEAGSEKTQRKRLSAAYWLGMGTCYMCKKDALSEVQLPWFLCVASLSVCGRILVYFTQDSE